jgi:hypothetical protein
LRLRFRASRDRATPITVEWDVEIAGTSPGKLQDPIEPPRRQEESLDTR